MTTFFVPYVQEKPAAVDINGHRLLILTSVADDLTSDLDKLGGTEVRTLEVQGNEQEALLSLAATIECGVVITPPGVPISTMIASLKRELPWLH